MQERVRVTGRGSGLWCYTVVTVLLLAMFVPGWLKPASISKLESFVNMPTQVKVYAPPTEEGKRPKLKLSVTQGALSLNGAKFAQADNGKYEYILMPMAEYAGADNDPAAWFAAQNPGTLDSDLVLGMGAQAGDVLYVRYADALPEEEGAQPGNWASIRIDGEAIGGVKSYSVFGLGGIVEQIERFLDAAAEKDTVQIGTLDAELRILRPVAAVLPVAAGLSVLLLIWFLAVLFVAPRRKRLVGSIAYGWTALLALMVVLGTYVMNETFLARESSLLAEGSIAWVNWTGFLTETTLFPAGALALALIALYTLHYKDKAKMHLMLRNWQLYLLMVPAIVLFAVFAYAPMFGITLAFKEYHLASTIQQMPWVGLHWFRYAFSDPSFIAALSNSVIISALHFLFGFPAPILLALLLNELRNAQYKRAVQTISFMPQFLSWVVIGSVFISLLSLDGPVNQFLMLLGMKPVHFMGLPDVFRGTLIVTSIWKGVGYGTVVYLAAISGVDPQLYECAKLDGSTRLKNMWYITLPCISNIIIVMLILRLGSVLESGFDQIVNMYNQTVYSTSDIIDTFIYRKVFGSKTTGSMYDYSAAVGFFKSVVGLMFIVGSNMLVRRFEGKEASLW